MGEKTGAWSGKFLWEALGDIDVGRSNLGAEMPVVVYRLFQYTLRDVLTEKYGKDDCIEVLRACGELAGRELTKHVLDVSLSFDDFVDQLQKTLGDLKIGILRIESVNPKTNEITLTVSEDLDCSGMPMLGEAVCNYDEGFIKGILDEYTKESYTVIEIDCWAKGDRVCRFDATVS